jgi:Chaperone of endosialidase/Head domain of trimeric autotransporter adhesin
MKTFLLLPLLLTFSYFSKAQSLAINTDGSTASNSAILDVKSTTKGLLIPRMDSAQRAIIPSPATGLLVYQTNKDSGFYFYDGTAWQQLINLGNNLWKKNGTHIHNTNTGNVGIGISNPLARLHVADSSVLFSATGNIPFTYPNPPISGEGRRMMWYPAKAAFRVGYVFGNNWDKDSIGIYSIAMGMDALAKGYNSVALGPLSSARGDYSISMGNNSIATDMYSLTIGTGDSATTGTAMAIGNYSNATGFSAIAIGNASNARGANSLSIGTALTASGLQSTAIGYNSTATAENSIALTNATASGNNSFAVGNSIASGIYATSFGESTIASGLNSTAFGISTTASGINATAFGYSNNATGNYSTTMGYGSQASGNRSIAIGNNLFASGDFSFAIGNGSTASGLNSIALGNAVVTASGDGSLATGAATNASGKYATSTGYFTTAKSLGGFSIGTHNESNDAPDPNVATLTDRVFQIGIGDGNPIDGKKNAITVLRNGNTGFGTFNPAAKIDVSAISFFGLTGTAMSNSVRVQAGNLASAAGSEIAIASLGFMASGSDNTALGIRAYRTTAGTGWATTALLLGYDVNNTVRAAGAGTGFISLHSNGNIGIGLIDAAEKLDILGKTKTTNLQVTNGAAVGKVLTSDAVGNANWADVTAPAAYWTASGNNIYNNNTGNVGIGVNNPLAKLHVADSSVVFSAAGFVTGPYGTAPVNGEGRRMMWYANKAAFRVGYVDGVQWDTDSIGIYSFAMGYNTKAKDYSTALGIDTKSSNGSLSTGGYTTASGQFAFATGLNATASGDASISAGEQTRAVGNYSFASGNSTNAFNTYSVALGNLSSASGEASFVMGSSSQAVGSQSAAFGKNMNTRAAYSFVAGGYNDISDAPTPQNPIATDRIFQIGNGLDVTTRSNALTILRNGNTGIGTTTPGYRLDLANGSFAFGTSNSRTETRDNAGLQGNAGAQSGFFETSSPVNYPAGANSWWHLIDTRHNNPANNFALQIAGSFFDQELWFRKTNNNSAQAWSRLLTSTNGWSAIGNSGTNPASNFIGTNDAIDFVLRTTGTERMRISAGGNVGIGTAAPNAQLQFSNSAVNRKLVLFEGANNDHQFYGLGINTATFRYQVDATGSDHAFFAAVNSTSSDELMRIKGNGNIGIGTSTPTKQTEIIGAASATPVTLVIGNRGGFGPAAMEFVSDYGLANQWRPGYIRSNDVGGFTGAVEVYTNGTGVGNYYTSVKGLEVRNGVTYTATGTVGIFSDERIKNNVQPFTGGLDIINRINPVSFYYNQQAPFQTDKMQIGILAQDLEKIAPYMVDKHVTKEFDDLRSVNNQAYIFLLINAVKEQQKQIDEQRKMIEELLKK